MKKIGIVVDQYKIDKFKEELNARGFEGAYKITPFTKDTLTIIIEVENEEFVGAQEEIRRLTKKIEYHFKRSN